MTNELEPEWVNLPDEDVNLSTGEPKVTNKGRKRAQVDVQQLIKLAEIGCSTNEMGKFFGCDGSVIRRHYSTLLDQVKTRTKARLRQAQLDSALNGDKVMLIWLGKQMLNQSDNGERNADDRQPLPWTDLDIPTTEDEAHADNTTSQGGDQ